MRTDYSLDTRCRRDAREKHTEKANDALRSLQEGEGVDACVGNGDICEGLRGSSARRKTRISAVRKTHSDGVEVRGHVKLEDVLF